MSGRLQKTLESGEVVGLDETLLRIEPCLDEGSLTGIDLILEDRTITVWILGNFAGYQQLMVSIVVRK